MLDNALINLFATQLETASAAGGWGYVVLQNYQPTQEGVPTAPTIFFEKLFDVEYGWPSTSYSQNSVAPIGEQLPDFAILEGQWVESTFQVTVLVIQDPTNLSLPTASDVANYLKQFLNSRTIIRQLAAQGVGVLRVSQVRNPKTKDERDLFEANPNFDIVLQHQRTLNLSVPGCDTVIGDAIPVNPIDTNYISDGAGNLLLDGNGNNLTWA